MIPPRVAQTSLGLGVTLAQAEALADRRLADRCAEVDFDFLNLGFDPGEIPSSSLARKLRTAGYWTVLHAVDLNLSDDPCPQRLQAVAKAARMLDARWVEEDLGSWVWGEAYLGSHQLEPPLTEDAARQTGAVVRGIESALGRPFLVENPPVYAARGGQDMWSHLLHVATAANCGMVLDVGHMIGAHINCDRPLQIADPGWPGWGLIREVHFSGFEVVRRHGRDCWFDRHSLPFPVLLLEWAREVFDRVHGPVAVTLELEGAPQEVVMSNVAAIRNIIAEKHRACAGCRPTPCCEVIMDAKISPPRASIPCGSPWSANGA